ncbi:hypothetical protein [Achromobacter aegrifaciens]|uniref:hypothetical protein n=1 Tax=Achromobacter aegrifaciens TaxID=1287736 RepID=UPI003207AFE8
MSMPMKDSGVEWLGKVPETWDTAPLRVFLKLRRDIIGPESATTKLLSLTLQGVIERDLENPTGKMPASFDGYQRISAGEMVFCLFDMDETPRTVGVAPQDGMLTGAYTVFHPKSELWARYLYYFFLHVDEYKRLKPFYKGLRKTIRPGPFLSIRVPRPAEAEAEAIVTHLDRATTRIDTLVAKKTRFIELLREKRQAMITRAVTKGLDAGVPMKDSGVEWLGKVPAHWDVVPPGVLFTDSKERAHTDDQMLSATQKYGVIPLAEFEALERRQVTKASTNFEMRKHVEVGDFVISMRSMDGGLERSHATGSVRSSYSVLKAHSEVHGPYFALLLKCSLFIQALRLTSNFIRDGQDLSFTHVKKVKLPLPDLAEQKEISEHVNRATSRIDTLIAKTERSIELLREHRTALITAAVTGKIDLRETA